MKAATNILFVLCAGVVAGCIGCSSVPSCLQVTPPEISLTGEQTVVERQIIGDYRELESDAWQVSSVQTNVQRQKGSAAQATRDDALMRALKVREFHRDKIRSYKNEGAIGEAKTGFVIYMTTDVYEKDKEKRAALDRVITEENKARAVIFERSLILSGKKEPTAAMTAAFGVRFAEEEQTLSQTNDWVQDKTGQWTRKK